MAQKRERPSGTSQPRSRGARSAPPVSNDGPPSLALSRTARAAKWIDSPGTHADRPGQSLATRNHDVIFGWAEARGARPATVDDGGRPRALRFDFPRYAGHKLTLIGWDEWFHAFDQRGLVFLFQERKKDGSQSNFFRLDTPSRIAESDERG